MHESLPVQDEVYHGSSERRPGSSASPRHHASQPVYRHHQEMTERPPRSKAFYYEPSESYRYHPYGPNAYAADPRYAYDHPAAHGPPRQRGPPPPPPMDPNGYQAPPRGRPLKNRTHVVSWAGPTSLPGAADAPHSSRNNEGQFGAFKLTGAQPSPSLSSSSAANGYGPLEGVPRTSPSMSNRIVTTESQPTSSSSLGPSRTHALSRHAFRVAGGAIQGNPTRSPVMIDLSSDDRSPVLDVRRVPVRSGGAPTSVPPRTPRPLTASTRETPSSISSKGRPNGVASMGDRARLRSPARVEIDLTDDGVDDGGGSLRRVPTEGGTVRHASMEGLVGLPAPATASAAAASSLSSSPAPAAATAIATAGVTGWMIQNPRDSEVPVSGEEVRVSRKDDLVSSSSTATGSSATKE
ncbi:hypothetical protein BGZ67_007693 [Mortierella alpina]|nr:hypothetical protein BGZ67_007693 [Mortierella alpina]